MTTIICTRTGLGFIIASALESNGTVQSMKLITDLIDDNDKPLIEVQLTKLGSVCGWVEQHEIAYTVYKDGEIYDERDKFRKKIYDLYKCPDCGHTLTKEEWWKLVDEEQLETLHEIEMERLCNEFGDCSSTYIDIEEPSIVCPNCKELIWVEPAKID